jgi:hypothetical protein
MAITAGKLIRLVLLALIVFLVVAQFVPVERTNPPFDPSETLQATLQPPSHVSAILERSCRDCHSNETRWPWYSRVAPISWLLAGDVSEGRNHMNLSEWGRLSSRRAGNYLEEICEEVTSGSMPQGKYVLLHPDAKLSQQDVDAICGWTETARAAMAPSDR